MSQALASTKAVVAHVARRLVVGPVMDLSAQLAFYAVLAMAPFLVVLTSLAAFAPSPDATQRLLFRARDFMPPEAYELVARVAEDLVERRSATLFTVSLVTSLWSASRAANSLRLSLNDAHQVKETRPWLRQQWLAVVLTIGGAVLLIASVVAVALGSSALSALAEAFGVELGRGSAVWMALRWPLALSSFVLLAALAFRVLPDARPPQRAIWPGALVATFLFLTSSRLFTLYVEGVADFGPTYGALTGGVLLLLWAWLSANAFLLGGEVTAALSRQAAAASVDATAPAPTAAPRAASASGDDEQKPA